MRGPYKIVIALTILLMIAAPAVSLTRCVDDHFKCCGIYTAGTEVGAPSDVPGFNCYDTRAERQDTPDVHAASLFVQPVWKEAGLIGPCSFAPMPDRNPSPLLVVEFQPLLCTFLI